MRNLKRAIAILLFFAGLLALLGGASFLLMPKDNTREAGMEEVSANGILGEPDNTIDVLILGDSESFAAFSPMQIWKETGYTSYVCGTASQQLSYGNTMLHRAFQKQKPKLVILETLTIYRKMTPGNVALDELARHLPVFRYHDRWKSLTLNDLNTNIQSSWTSFNRGHWTTKKVDPCSNDPYMIPTDYVPEIRTFNKMYVQALKKFCDQNGAKLLLISTPSPVNWSMGMHNGVEKLAKELNCEYIDLNLMNDQLQIDWSQDTHDKGDHLNHFGAEKVTRFLAKHLKAMGILEDHRRDPAYARWDEDFIKYEADLADS